MTRLIDADSIPWFVEGVGDIPVITKEEIDKMPTVEAIPMEYINRRIEALNEYIGRWGGSFEHEEMVNAYIHEVSALVRLISDWRKEE